TAGRAFWRTDTNEQYARVARLDVLRDWRHLRGRERIRHLDQARSLRLEALPPHRVPWEHVRFGAQPFLRRHTIHYGGSQHGRRRGARRPCDLPPRDGRTSSVVTYPPACGEMPLAARASR